MVPWKNIKKEKGANSDSYDKVEYPQYNLRSFDHSSVIYLNRKRLDQQLDENTYNTVEDLYKHITDNIHQGDKETLGNSENRSTNKNYMWSEKIEEQTRKKKKAYLMWLNTNNDNDRKKYRQIQKETRG